jgi:hypothetical protein
MAGVAGLEPVTSAVTGQRSNQLSYTPARGKLIVKNVSPRVKLETIPRIPRRWVKLNSGSRRQGGGGGEPR